MASLNLLIKPASGRCNLACRYCFYRDVAEHRAIEDFGLMSTETAEILVRRAFETGAEQIAFAFQGGEPTMADLPFFERFAALVREREAAAAGAGRTVRARFAMQTNGIAIDAPWARFLKKEDFLLGVSIDGPRLLHDAFRVRRDDSGTYVAVMEGVAALRAEGVPVNALCVVDAAAADNAAAVYRHLRSRGFDWIQFIPCLDPLDEEPGGRSWSLTPVGYGRFLKETFDLRYADWRTGAGVNVRWFDNLIAMASGLPPESCGMAGSCAVNFTIESDGSVYPCDFYVVDEWRLGSVRDSAFERMRTSETARRFVETSRAPAEECRDCFALPLCRGGCRRDRYPFKDGKPALNRYCASFKDFFAYAGNRIMEMAEAEKRARG